ncbi:MAG: SDR family oxidoreductase [Lachnospiraceae bacterium]
MKSAIITGAARGIGEACAIEFAKNGYHLILNAHTSGNELLALKTTLEQRYRITVHTHVGDISQPGEVQNLFSLAETHFGSLSVLVNNAGISQISLLQDTSLGAWQEVLQTNLTSAFLCARQAIGLLRKGQNSSIINISSQWGCVGAACEVAYSASKGGLNSLTKALAKELSLSNIRVNAVACGVIETRMNECFTAEERQELTNEIPMGRMGLPAEVASLVYTLAAEQTYVTGQVIAIDGGWI